MKSVTSKYGKPSDYQFQEASRGRDILMGDTVWSLIKFAEARLEDTFRPFTAEESEFLNKFSIMNVIANAKYRGLITFRKGSYSFSELFFYRIQPFRDTPLYRAARYAKKLSERRNKYELKRVEDMFCSAIDSATDLDDLQKIRIEHGVHRAAVHLNDSRSEDGKIYGRIRTSWFEMYNFFTVEVSGNRSEDYYLSEVKRVILRLVETRGKKEG